MGPISTSSDGTHRLQEKTLVDREIADTDMNLNGTRRHRDVPLPLCRSQLLCLLIKRHLQGTLQARVVEYVENVPDLASQRFEFLYGRDW